MKMTALTKKISCMLIALLLCGCGSKTQIPVTTPTETSATEMSQEGETEAATEETETDEIITGVNIIPGGDFSSENSSWGMYQESGGIGNFSISGGKLKAKVLSTGKVNHGVQVYCGGFELLQGGRYEMSFDISSDVARTIQWRIQFNSGDYHAYIEQSDVEIGEEMTTVCCEFTMEEASDPAPRLCFNIGDQDSAQGLESHSIYLDNVSLVLLDASSAHPVDTSTSQVDINVNQVGYLPGDIKRAVFRQAGKDAEFEIIDAATKKTVYSGKVEGSVTTQSVGETVSYGDFTEFTTPGTYLIKAEESGESYEFTISDTVYDDAFDNALKMFYLQRCGMELEEAYAGDFAHGICHTQMATLYGTDNEIEISGGWHDAGDYGRYTVPAAKAAADLLLTYETYPDKFGDDTGIPESGNQIPDILDELRYELTWLLKMQAEDGGVYHKVTGLNFEGVVMPEACTEKLYVMPESKTATGDFCAVMYMASRVYAQVDSDFSNSCLEAAKRALPYLEERLNERNYTNPTDVQTGEYGDNSSRDEYLWALCEGYKTTQDVTLAQKIADFDYDRIAGEGLGWATVTEYAYYAYLTAPSPIADCGYNMKAKFLSCADEAKETALSDCYGSSIREDYPWGSNMTIANNGMLMLMAREITGDESYLAAAKMQLDYLLGVNTNSYCFLTGYGGLSPQNPHHRPSQYLGKTMPGMLVGGPDSALEDPFAVVVLSGQPKAHCYVDNEQSYSCNEITIYWNSPLIYLMAEFL